MKEICWYSEGDVSFTHNILRLLHCTLACISKNVSWLLYMSDHTFSFKVLYFVILVNVCTGVHADLLKCHVMVKTSKCKAHRILTYQKIKFLSMLWSTPEIWFSTISKNIQREYQEWIDNCHASYHVYKEESMDFWIFHIVWSVCVPFASSERRNKFCQSTVSYFALFQPCTCYACKLLAVRIKRSNTWRKFCIVKVKIQAANMSRKCCFVKQNK